MSRTRYLISLDASAMDHIWDEDMPAVGKAAQEVVQEALNAKIAVSCRCAQEVREFMPDPELDAMHRQNV